MMRAGDIVLVHGHSVYSKAISFGQGLHYRGPAHYKYWTHVAVVVTDDGDLIEALWPKVQRTHISKYDQIPHYVVDITPWATDSDRAEVVDYALHCEGTEYGIYEVVALGGYCATGKAVSFSVGNQLVCSALAAEALSRTRIIWPKEPLQIFPADHAEFFAVPGLPK